MEFIFPVAPECITPITSELSAKFDSWNNWKLDRSVNPGDIFKHFKGGLYQVIAVATHTETQEKLVVYQPLFANEVGEKPVWVRPMDMFLSPVDFEKYPAATQPYRLIKMKMMDNNE